MKKIYDYRICTAALMYYVRSLGTELTKKYVCLLNLQALEITEFSTRKFFVIKYPTNASRKQLDLLMHSRFTPTCFSKSLPLSGGRSYLRSYSSNICIVDAYGLRSVQCGQLSRDVTKSVPVWSVVEGCNQECASVVSCRGM
jgi:hypothetical protein